MKIQTRFFVLDSVSPLLKQAPMAVMTALAVVIVLWDTDYFVTSPLLLLIGVATVAVATVIAGVMSVRHVRAPLTSIIPALDCVAVAAISGGTGASSSIFVALQLLPVVWFATNEGYRNILYAVLGVLLVRLTPFVVDSTAGDTPGAVARTVFSCLAYAIAAAVVNELSRQARIRAKKLNTVVDELASSLVLATENAAHLAESEARLGRSELMFRGVWEAVTEQAVIATDVTGLIDAWNPGAARMLGLSAEQVEDIRHVDEFHLASELEDRARQLHYPAGETVLNPGFSALVEAARLGSADVREWTYVRSDGSHIPVELSVTPRLDDTGTTVGYLFVVLDRTKAHEVAKLKDDFVGLISHELRTPLSSILGYLELLRDDDETELTSTQMQYLGVAERNAYRLLTLVGDLLFTAQVESGKFNLEQHVQPLTPIVQAAIDSARPAAARAGLTLDSSVVPGDTLVRGDSVRIGQACDNLISNAIKFTPKGGTVTVSLVQEADSAFITVNDTGMGIAADELDQLFHRFFRATTATRNAVPGVGLGLSITKAIATAHGGCLQVESEEGIGTSFRLGLPRVHPVLVVV